ncbi:serine/threonine protein kinase [Planctomycetaceae bacterium SH139]
MNSPADDDSQPSDSAPHDPLETHFSGTNQDETSPSFKTEGPQLEKTLGDAKQPPELIDPTVYGSLASPGKPLDIPALVGRYFIIEPLGTGGMGQVFLAEQRVPVKRFVALKLIKPGMDSREVLKRFDAERQALALMDHPSIAKILDAGDTADGRPYFAMELVSGKPLTDYCDEHRLNLRQRLDLFVQVCDAVQHAHQKGVLHRDLKPSNILVATVDGRAIPKVIDFGLAKALQTVPGHLDQGVTTKIGQVLGTLKYMSPEQANLDEVDIDTRTDIYALGVILYELLTGTTPLDDASIRGRALVKLLEIVRTNEPLKPSSRLLSSGQARTLQEKTDDQAISKKVTEARSTDIRRLRQVLLGDLDWIAMKAIENDRRRRYQTAAGFADDVRRFLTDQPVLARPPSFLYWMHKSIRRHRLAAASLALIVVCLGAAIFGLAYGFNRSRALAQVERRARLLSESQREFEQAFLPRKYQLAEFAYEDIEALSPLLDSIGNIATEPAQLAKTELLRTYGMAIRTRIENSQATQAELRAASRELQQFATLLDSAPDASLNNQLNDLRTALRRRLTNWQTANRLDAIPAATSLMIAEDLAEYVGTRLSFDLNVEDLEALSSFELALWENDTTGYTLRVATSGANEARSEGAPSTLTFAESMRTESALTFSLSRGSEILAIEKLRVPLAATWRVMGEIDAGRIVFQVNGQSLAIRDIFAADSQGSTVRLRGSAQLSPTAVHFEVKQRPEVPSPIETADFLFLAKEQATAAGIYAQSEALEAQFKLALCRVEQADRTNARQIFAEIFQAPRPATDDEAIWHLLSGMWLYSLELDARNYENKQDILNRLIATYPGSLSQYLPLVPLRLKTRLLADLRKDGPRWAIALQTETDILPLRFAVNMDAGNMDAGNSAELSRRARATEWRLADALRATGRLAEAEEILLSLLRATEDRPADTPRERVALIGDLVWLYIRQEKIAEATRLIENQVDLSVPNLPIEQAPLLTEHARIDLLSGDLAAAKTRMDRFFALAQPAIDSTSTDEAVGRQSFPLPHAAFSDACLVAGLIASDMGQQQEANSLWGRGLRKNWKFWSEDKQDAFGYGHQLVDFQTSLTHEAILHSLTGESRLVDLQENLRAELAGKRGGRNDIFMLTQVFGYDMKMLSTIVKGMFDVPEIGKPWRRQMILRNVGFKDYFLRPMPLLMYRFVRLQFLANATLSAAIEREGFEVCQELVAMYDNGQLTETTDFPTILYFIIGPFSANSIHTIEQRYPPRLVGGLAYLAFKKAELLNNLKSEEARGCLRAIAALEGMPQNMAKEVRDYVAVEEE